MGGDRLMGSLCTHKMLFNAGYKQPMQHSDTIVQKNVGVLLGVFAIHSAFLLSKGTCQSSQVQNGSVCLSLWPHPKNHMCVITTGFFLILVQNQHLLASFVFMPSSSFLVPLLNRFVRPTK
jgi:hypothetical protein